MAGPADDGKMAPRRYCRFAGSAVGIIVLLSAVAASFVPSLLQPPAGAETWLFFDGVCNLCDGFVNFVADYESQHKVRFGAIQKHKELLQTNGAGRYAEGGEEALSTLVVIQNGQVFVRSDAALRVLLVMDQPWRMLAILLFIPKPARDFGYRLVAKYRYAIFGQKESCREPTGDFKQRFLEYVPEADEKLPFAAHL
eukprot:gnl/TRDRNA2_/TRDRNA2_89444_c0_seq1.p1 gnl/TRDRNA2_/TRDRNA2_89444_c0~~gnl/TRDRNA2_/TRDRNA2_89444_c0_seq1.p1  ORF type:complete len:209 (+),score=36.77 gnl/TRDRNA2_/TRDRNA2_89444_c0_seq1:38-628(+)